MRLPKSPILYEYSPFIFEQLRPPDFIWQVISIVDPLEELFLEFNL